MQLITMKELGIKLNMSEEWIEQAITTGEIPPPIRLGEHIRWADEMIDKWIKDGCPKIMKQKSYQYDDGAFYEKAKILKENEKYTIIDVLERTDGNREKAAHLLGIGERTLYRKIKEYGLINKG